MLGPAGVGEEEKLIGQTSSICSYVDQHEKKVFVDTVGYGDARFTVERQHFLLFFRELVMYTSTGYNWLFLVLRFERFTQDILIYVEMLEQLLGDIALTRCTIVFTHCKIKDMNRQKCIDANKDSQRILDLLTKAHSVIFGDMDTFENGDSDLDSDSETRTRINKILAKQRVRFMEKILQQIDGTDDHVLILERSWFRTYWTRFTEYVGYFVEKISRRTNEWSKRYRLVETLKNQIPVTIYYENCSICRELIVEIWDTEPTVCITKCGHIFHYTCLQKWFEETMQCPLCRRDLRSLPERIFGQRVELHSIDDGLKDDSET